ncbi:CAP domain-containing protein [Actibacterium sp. XHP0104]|uniref:CAP domain-containing protein n=1 Tax=Actibacterium sp. XHP0104 TaxID=2984335 RepID=UPI0021E70C2E|nr:CAP domain-containing protein [Actibacterium sp. XHP0104]MCV2882077.1 CAP domain-containing protein [Actibacterium sp. XHP0104]
MLRLFSTVIFAAFTLAACTTTAPQYGPDGKPLPRVYRIAAGDTAKIQYRMLDSVNALRQVRGVAPLQLNAQLNAAAATHSRDMSVQNRPWHFGSNGSSPIDRVQRAGYPGTMLGENISETYETELETLAAWMEQPDTANVVMDARARDLGFAFFQEPNGKIWWTMVTGAGTGLSATAGF